MSKNYTVIIQHGTGGKPDENWFPWLAQKLKELNVNVFVPKLPTPEGQDFSSWVEEFKRITPDLDENTILIGHSLAPAFLIRYVAQQESCVRATFFVAAFMDLLGLEDFDKLNHSFVSGDLDWKSTAKKIGKCRVYNSDNDPYVPISMGKSVAEKLGADFTTISNGGHINTSSGYDKFEKLLEDIRQELGI